MNQIQKWQRAVIKVGSALIAPEGELSTQFLSSIAKFIIDSRELGKELVLVSSGSVAAGAIFSKKISKKKQRSIPEQQALAAIGQPQMMQHWQNLFNFPCAQVLLTKADLQNRQRFVNAKNTLNQLLGERILAIVNENDSVAVDELKVGDNDNLAAHVAVLVDADVLFICSDVDGLYSANPKLDPKATLQSEIIHINTEISSMAGDSNNPIATGGMMTKLEAAKKATASGIDTFIINGCRAEVFEDLKNNQNPGTWFHRSTTPMAAKKHWLTHLQKSQGQIVVDSGAEQALVFKGASLLPSGIVSLSGDFSQGEMVDIISNQTGNLLASGICQYSIAQLQKIKRHQSHQIAEILGYLPSEEVIHRNDLFLIKESTP